MEAACRQGPQPAPSARPHGLAIRIDQTQACWQPRLADDLDVRDRQPLAPADIIHSVTNPIPRLTGAIHVYGGISSTPRAANGIRRRPYDMARTMRVFEEVNAFHAKS